MNVIYRQNTHQHNNIAKVIYREGRGEENTNQDSHKDKHKRN